MSRITLLAFMLLTSTLMARQPNVIIIFTDDQGSVDMNIYGATDLKTPHMDALAKRGVRFTEFYAAFLSTTDDRIGALLKKVDDLGLTKDTIVVFQSDHGASKEVRAHGGGGSSGPHRGAKFSLYEGGLRIPAIISWPGHLPENQPRNQVATGCDWYPTILELCKLPPAAHKIDGKSLMSIMNSADAPSAHRSFNWKSGRSWAVREGKWKLVVTGKKIELYDIPNDLGEAKNLANAYPEVVARLENVSQEYWKSITVKK